LEPINENRGTQQELSVSIKLLKETAKSQQAQLMIPNLRMPCKK